MKTKLIILFTLFSFSCFGQLYDRNKWIHTKRHQFTDTVTFSSSFFKIKNPAGTFQYTLNGSAITNSFNLTLPLITGNATLSVNNLDNSFTINDLAELYRLRWGIETCFFCLKSHQMLGTFSGYSKQVILQDIWANLLFYNIKGNSLLLC